VCSSIKKYHEIGKCKRSGATVNPFPWNRERTLNLYLCFRYVRRRRSLLIHLVTLFHFSHRPTRRRIFHECLQQMENNATAPPPAASLHAHAPDRSPPPRHHHLLLHAPPLSLHPLHQRRPRVTPAVTVGAVAALAQDLRLRTWRNQRLE